MSKAGLKTESRTFTLCKLNSTTVVESVVNTNALYHITDQSAVELSVEV